MVRPTRWLAVTLGLALLAGCGGASRDFELVGTVERTSLELAAPVSEVVVEIAASLGSRVDAGAVVVRLDTEVAEAAESFQVATYIELLSSVVTGSFSAVVSAMVYHDLRNVKDGVDVEELIRVFE